MTSTTTNYGWTVPTSSDLVKNGATAISTVGQSVDTFLFRPFTRNAVLNGSLNVWQRGTSFAYVGGQQYTADRWFLGSGALGRTVSRQTASLTGFQYCARVQRDSANTNTSIIKLMQTFETVNSLPFAGQTITFSFYARAGANYSATSNGLLVNVRSGTGTDQNIDTGYTGSADVILQTATLTTSWQRFTYTGSVASTATEIGFILQETPVGTAGAADYFEVTGVQLEVGSQATPYAPATPTYATELAACQRYLPSVYLASCIGYAYATNAAVYSANFPVPARVNPTGMTLSGGTNTAYALNTGYTVTPTFNSASVNMAQILVSSGLTITAGQGSRLDAPTLLFTGCEL